VLERVTNGVGHAIGLTRIAAAALLLLFAAAPAAAGQSRAVLAVTAIVAPSCQIAREDAARHAVACSVGTRFSTATMARHDERPLDEAAAILGGPVRGARGVAFAAPVQPSAPAATHAHDPGATRYLTITY